MGFLDRLLRLVGLDFDLDLHSEPFDRITAQLYLGGRPRPEGVGALKAAGITDVVSCLPASERDAMAFLERDFRARFIPVHDGIHEDLSEALPAFFAALSEAGADGRLLVHCEVGVSRSATLAVAHVMRSTGSRFYEAFCSVRACRPQILPNIGFASQLQRFELAHHPRRGASELASLTRYLHEVCNVPGEARVVQAALEAHDFDAYAAIRSIFDGEVPRVVQGVRRR